MGGDPGLWGIAGNHYRAFGNKVFEPSESLENNIIKQKIKQILEIVFRISDLAENVKTNTNKNMFHLSMVGN